jgi:diguanylate cyclase (GGDEF)-like protein
VATDGGRVAFRQAVCARAAPWAVLLTAGVLLVVTAVNAAVGPPIDALSVVANVLVAGCLLVVAALSRVARVPDAAWPWLLAGSALGLVVAGQVQVYVLPDGASFAYVLVIMVVFAPLTLSWVPALLAYAVMLAGCVVVARQWPGSEMVDWVVVAVTAAAVGLGMLWLSVRNTDALADLTARASRQATVDELTGLLNRRGVAHRMPGLVGIADRADQQIGVAFLDVRGLKAANDEHGHDAGDEILRAVASAIRDVARSADVVGRWGGDEFVVVGAGLPDDAAGIEARLAERLRRAAVDRRLTPIVVSAGTAFARIAPGAGALEEVDLLITAADDDMYERRGAPAE